MKTLSRIAIAIVALTALIMKSPPALAAEATVNDTALFLAGLPVASSSPLYEATKDSVWQRHAKFLDQAFEKLGQRQLDKIRMWSKTNLANPQPTVYYMFSGPDVLYANAFFPTARTYILSGLEPIGAVPDLAGLRRGGITQAVRNVEYALGSILNYSFFITRNMRTDLRSGPVNGTLPILYVFLARSGKIVREVTPIQLDEQGVVRGTGEDSGKNAVPGVKILFADSADGDTRTLYYFSTNVANDGVAKSGFLKFCEKLAPGDALIKSASYLMHNDHFSRVRDFLLANSKAIVQDDSGIPLRFFDRTKWTMKPFGAYRGPIAIFPGRYQQDYLKLFRQAQPMDFGIGYRWRMNESNLLLAIRNP